MSSIDIIQVFLFLFFLTMLTPWLGRYMYRVFVGEKHALLPVLGWLEAFIYRIIGTHVKSEQTWKEYTIDLLFFNLMGLVFLFFLQLIQQWLPLNPEHLGNVSSYSAFNTAASFSTNTNWQGYAGETTMSYITQMIGLTVQNFLSAATGITVLLALARGLSLKTSQLLGNFWVDLTRSILYLLLPISAILAIILVSQGVIQNLHSYVHLSGIQGMEQTLPMGPAASQVAIKQLGTNGGGFFNSNSAHPFENPTPLSNFLELLAILLIPSALTYTFGRMVHNTRHGWTLFLTMMIMLLSGLVISLVSEHAHVAALKGLPLMEGKETRFGVTNSVLWSTVTTAASNGSVNAMHDSLSPLTGMIAMVNIMLGEVIFGGVGAGLYGMVIFIILTVFIAGLMVGRTPEYLGKKIDAFEVKMAIIAVLLPSLIILVFSAVACTVHSGLSSLTNSGPHGLSEILYAFSSAAGNNGSAFAGLNANTRFYNILLGIGMIIGRFGVIVPAMAIAGSLALKKITPVSQGTFRTDNWLFALLLIVIILIIAGLTFFPALVLGPIAEHVLLQNGVTF
jgi:K+-transporting ATPase ATPase A chain